MELSRAKTRTSRIQQVLMVTLGGLAISIFFSQSGIDIFGLTSLFVLLFWKYYIGYEDERTVPSYILVAVALYLCGQVLGAVISDNLPRGLSELKKYWNILLCGLLFTCPLPAKNRRLLTVVFFVGASASGLMGIFQYYGIGFERMDRAHGFTHPLHFATNLAFVCASAVLILLVPNKILKGSRRATAFVTVTALLSFWGLVVSQSRGVIIAFFSACLIVLLMYNFRRGIIFLLVFMLVMVLAFSLSSPLRERGLSTFTSLYTEDERGSTGNRLELWKGSLLIFSKSPFFGTGTGDFQQDVEGLISSGSLKKIPITFHAHNIFFQALSTQGLAGLALLLGLLACLVYWGAGEINPRGIAGYLMVSYALLIIVGGLTENNLGISKVVAAYCLSLGLMGGYGKNNDACN